MFLETLPLRTHLETRLGGGPLSHYGIRKDHRVVVCVHTWGQTAYAARFRFCEHVDSSFCICFRMQAQGSWGSVSPALWRWFIHLAKTEKLLFAEKEEGVFLRFAPGRRWLHCTVVDF